MISNLFAIEENISLETLHLRYADVTSSSGRITFNKPFSNKCLSVMLTDYANSSSINKQAIANFDKNGFNFFTTSSTQERFYYLAIGY